MGVHKYMSLQSLEFSEPNSKYSLFLFLLVYLEFGFEIYRDCEDASCEHLQICFNIFCHLEFEIFELVAW
jgi:hypothetical protein